MEGYTEAEIARMKRYEQATGQRVIYTFEEKCGIYRTKDWSVLIQATFGIRDAIKARENFDNEDSFSGVDDSWKLKVLIENLSAIEKVLAE
jgi:hypothetical protein